ncbi:MAG: hypothetical protein NZM04_10860 [Methylacidiphilales bacterium]|nr:hypothetical protein [Candidatus Methylacidiphilales bacterium]
MATRLESRAKLSRCIWRVTSSDTSGTIYVSSAQSVASWVKCVGECGLAASIPQPTTDDDTIVELDELFTFVGSKKMPLSHHAG